MTIPRPIGELELHAYVDGELDADDRAEVEAWLADRPQDAARVEAYRDQKRQLHALYDGVREEDVPARTTALFSRRKTPARSISWMRIAASILLLALGGLAGWGSHGIWQAQQDERFAFVERALGAHIVYVREARHAVEVGADEEDHLVAWLSKRLGHPLKAPKLGDAGFELVGGRLLADGAAPAAQFMYENAAGQRVTVYLRTGRDGTHTAFRFLARNGVSAFYWADGPFAYALIGRMPRDDLIGLARLIYRDVEG